MEAPARFPVTEADLADWAVHADWLISRGDPRGDLIAADLALPAAPSRDQLAAFHAVARRFVRARKHAPIAWRLGHAMTLAIEPRHPNRRWPEGPDVGLLASARDFLLTEPARRLEALSIPFGLFEATPVWRRLFAALPPTCRTLGLSVLAWSERAAAALLDAIPASIRELAIRAAPVVFDGPGPELLIDDRLDVVDLGEQVPRGAAHRRLAGALVRTRSVRVRLAEVGPMRLPTGRWELGRPGDAVLVQPDRLSAQRLARAPLLRLQRRFGPIPVRAQLAARLPEPHALEVDGDDVYLEGRGDTLVRRGEAWTLRIDRAAQLNGAPIPHGRVVPIADGDRLTIERAECVFLAHNDAASRAIALLDARRPRYQ